jgi:nucleotide-binding universal stress UspA family protein
MNSRQRDRIVDREVMKLELRAARRRSTSSDEPRGRSRSRPRAVLVAVEPHDSAAAAATVAAAGLLADALGAELILAGVAPLVQPAPPDAPVAPPLPLPAGDRQAKVDALTHRQVMRTAEGLPAGVVRRTMLRWGATGPALVEAARQEQVDLVVVSTSGGADHYVVHHCQVPVLVVPVEPPADAAA